MGLAAQVRMLSLDDFIVFVYRPVRRTVWRAARPFDRIANGPSQIEIGVFVSPEN